MKTLILVAHGSRNPHSNKDITSLVQTLRESLGDTFVNVYHAFLELSSPRLPEVIDLCIHEGTRSVTLLPYFLLSGYHVTQEIPQILLRKQQQYPKVTFQLTPHLGHSHQLPQVLLSLLKLDSCTTQ